MATQPPSNLPSASLFEDALAAGAALQNPKSIAVGGGNPCIPFVVTPDTYSLKDLEHLFDAPFRRAGRIEVHDLTSLIRVVNDYKSESTRIYGESRDGKEPWLTAVFDDANGQKAGWGDFRAHYPMPLAFEWKEWKALDRKPQKQADFAAFMENRYVDVTSPSSADMLEISRTLEAKKAVLFKKGIRLSNGENQLAYEERTDATAANGTILIPETFSIAIPVFHGTTVKWAVDARLRYRIGDQGSMAMWYELIEPHRTVEHALREIWTLLEQAVAIPIIAGLPRVAD